jgi:hypothetical protein
MASMNFLFREASKYDMLPSAGDTLGWLFHLNSVLQRCAWLVGQRPPSGRDCGIRCWKDSRAVKVSQITSTSLRGGLSKLRSRRSRRAWPWHENVGLSVGEVRDHIAVAHELRSDPDDFVCFAQTLRGDEKERGANFPRSFLFNPTPVAQHFFLCLGQKPISGLGQYCAPLFLLLLVGY